MIQPNRTALLRPALLVALALTTACGGKDGAAAGDSAAAPSSAPSVSQSGGDGDLADVTAYELSMEKLDRFYAAQRNIALKAKDLSPEQREALKAKNEADDSNAQSLDDMARKIEGEPLMVAAIKDAGLSAREFATLTMSILQTGMAAAVLDMRPNDNADSLAREMKANMANIRWFRENKAAIDAKQAQFQAEMKRLGLDKLEESGEGQ